MAIRVTVPIEEGVIVNETLVVFFVKSNVFLSSSPPPLISTCKFPLKLLSTVTVKLADSVFTGPCDGPVKIGSAAVLGDKLTLLISNIPSPIETHLSKPLTIPCPFSNQRRKVPVERAAFFAKIEILSHRYLTYI